MSETVEPFAPVGILAAKHPRAVYRVLKGAERAYKAAWQAGVIVQFEPSVDPMGVYFFIAITSQGPNANGMPFRADYGDGVSEDIAYNWISTERTHIYAEPGTYTVVVTSELTRHEHTITVPAAAP